MKISKSAKKFVLLGLIILPLTFSLVPADANAVRYSGGRTSAIFNAWYSDSIHSYGYAGWIDEARFTWNPVSSNIEITRVISSNGTPDKYYAGVGTDPFTAGGHNGYKKSASGSYVVAGNNETWAYSAVSIYQNAINFMNLSDAEIQTTIEHEMGHSLGLDHTPSNGPNSIMKSLRQSIKPTTYDISEVRAKWGN